MTSASRGGEPVQVDAHLRDPERPWLYAIGDCNGRALLTHEGKYQARIAADHLLGDAAVAAARDDGRLAPRVVFTEPQVAAVGHTQADGPGGGDAGPHRRCGRHRDTAGGSFIGRGIPSRARLVVDEDRNVLVGATFTGAEVADMLHAATVAVVGEVPIARLRHAVPPFPTRSEVWLGLLDAVPVELGAAATSSRPRSASQNSMRSRALERSRPVSSSTLRIR